MDGIDLNMKNKEYNSIEVLLNSDNLDDSDKFNSNNDEVPSLTNTSVPNPETAIIWQTTNDSNIFDKLYMPHVESKSSWIVQKNKSITTTTNKLEEMHVDL